MASNLTMTGMARILPQGTGTYLKHRAMEAAGLTLVLAAGALLAALVSYAPTDPSWDTATTGPVRNWLGAPGAWLADLLLQALGMAGLVPAVVAAAWGSVLWRRLPLHFLWLRLVLGVTAVLLLAVALSALPTPAAWPLITRLGGAMGTVLLERSGALVRALDASVADGLIGLPCALLGALALAVTLALPRADWQRAAAALASVARALGRTVQDVGTVQRVEPVLSRAGRRPAAAPSDDEDADPRDADGAERPAGDEASEPPTARVDLVEPKAPALRPGRKAQTVRQGQLNLGEGVPYAPPPLDLLQDVPTARGTAMDKAALEQNARLLEKVLQDFGVRGTIVKVRPGPVVTLYELEPAPGTKSSRVIGLADDIARSMSAVSVRVAVVPGRNVIGIELPNQTREMVGLRELLESEDFERTGGKIGLALGKDIGGTPVAVDLARMPHLLIAGTTGSGKSVAINTMILSLLYQRAPEECRLIMIDPKMLELSVYEGIPHLLCPVVTEPGKAVVALKWAVREMEERYRAMSQLGVRNIGGYNGRLAEARKRSETLTRRVQTGFDVETGQPVHEDQALDLNPLPYIVVVVDEMADLMLVAGKDIEAAIQRLAQMARAAGIHVIMATQRPSVDVITGTIKANFPTRISFQVTSKIDSRTILGEQGAEQLLGRGDMLYMAGGGRISRVHGPFVSDEEVERVVAHLRSQGEPQYVDAVTEDDDEGGFTAPGAPGGGPSGDALYDEAVAVVAREGKASTSFVQRHLQIGYNRAARLIERMEQEGVVSKPNRVGRREVLIGSGGDDAG